METPEPFIDKFVGPMTEELMLTGRDEFMQTAADRGLLYAEYNMKTGATLDYRVGRHLGGAAEVIKQMGEFYPAKTVGVSWPTYAEVMEKGIGCVPARSGEGATPKRVFMQLRAKGSGAMALGRHRRQVVVSAAGKPRRHRDVAWRSDP